MSTGVITVYGHKHPDVAASYNNSALIYEDQGLYEKSFVHYKALENDITVSGQECLSTWGKEGERRKKRRFPSQTNPAPIFVFSVSGLINLSM
jgi:hypothetical protein